MSDLDFSDYELIRWALDAVQHPDVSYEKKLHIMLTFSNYVGLDTKARRATAQADEAREVLLAEIREFRDELA